MLWYPMQHATKGWRRSHKGDAHINAGYQVLVLKKDVAKWSSDHFKCRAFFGNIVSALEPIINKNGCTGGILFRKVQTTLSLGFFKFLVV